MKATGPGLEPGCKAGRRLPITVDSRKAGKAPLKVVVEDEVGKPVDIEMEEIEPGLDEVAYTPKTPGMIFPPFASLVSINQIIYLQKAVQQLNRS